VKTFSVQVLDFDPKIAFFLKMLGVDQQSSLFCQGSNNSYKTCITLTTGDNVVDIIAVITESLVNYV
jgi:hypothetical protein